MHLTIILAFIFTRIYVTVCFNDNTSVAISRGQKGEFNFGHSGYVYLTSDPTPRTLDFTKCQYYDVNVTSCSFMNKTLKTTHDIILMRAWLAVTLRDNIATIFSYLLHLPKETFSNEIYSSLHLLYHELQKNNIKVMDLAARLKPISNGNTIFQLTMLFKSLHTTVPSYCRNALDNMSKVFFKKRDKLKNTLKEADIDLFADIPMELMPLLRFKNSPKNFNKNIEVIHGKEYAILFSYLVDRKIFLSQPVLAVLLLNTRFNHLPPQAMEDLRYLADVLRYNKIKNWNFSTASVQHNFTEPYDLIQRALISLKESPGVNQMLKETINNFLKFSIKPHNTEEQPYYDKMRLFLSRASFNVSFFFEKLIEDVNTPDAVYLKKLVDYNKIKYAFAVKGFIPHYYDTPDKIRLAFLQRIKNRVLIPKSDQEPLLNVINFLKRKVSQELQLKGNRLVGKMKREAINDLEPNFTFPEGKKILDASIVIYGRSINRMDEISSETNTCSVNSTKVSFSTWLQNIDTIDAETTIRMIQNASTILEIFLSEPKILKSIKEIISEVGTYYEKNITEEITTQNITEENIKYLDANSKKNANHSVIEDSVTNKSNFNRTVYFQKDNNAKSKITKNQLIHILKQMLNLKKVKARPIVFYEVLRLYCILVHGSNNHLTSLNLDSPYSKAITGDLIGNNSLIVSSILNNPQFIKNLSNIQFEEYSTKQIMLEALFKKMLTMQRVQQDSALFNEIVRLLRSIIPLPIDLGDLTKAILVDTLDDDPEVKIIENFLSARGAVINLGDDFDVGHYRTKGTLLYAILEKNLNESKENTTLSISIKKILPKIDCSIIGAEKVKDIENGAASETVDFKKLIKYGLDKTNMSSEVIEAFLNMTTWNSIIDPLKYASELDSSIYETRAEFINGFFDNLIGNIDHKAAEMKKDVELMKSVVKMTGTGLEPVDYL